LGVISLQDITAIRLLDNRLAWYPPGASDEPQWLDDDVSRERLRAALNERRGGFYFAVPGAEARLLTLPITPEEKKHIRKSLPYMLEEQVAADIDELHFAHCNLDKDHLGVAICARENMEQWRNLLAEFPGVLRWVPEPLLLPWSEGQWCVVLEGDTAIVRVARCEGFTVERDMVATFLAGVLQESEAPSAVVVYGSDQAADLGVLPADLADSAQWRRGNLCTALLLSEASEINLNVLQGEYAPRLPLQRWWLQWRAVAALFIAAFMLQLVAGYFDYRNLQKENQALRSAVEQSFRKAFPKGQYIDAEKQLRRQLDAMRGSGQSSGFVSLVELVGQVVSTMPRTTISTINYSDKADEMRMNIVAADFSAVEQLRSRINDSGLDAVMESSNAQGDRVRARLRIGKRS
jgi:general secretion pathway protein L